MKPEPHIVHRALTIVEASARSAVLVGDSVSDVEVARATGVRSIGYAKTEQREAELRGAGADAVTRSIVSLVHGAPEQIAIRSRVVNQATGLLTVAEGDHYVHVRPARPERGQGTDAGFNGEP